MAQMDNAVDAVQVCADVGVSQHHALGQAGRAGGEHDRRHVVRPDCRETQQAFQDCRRQQPGSRGRQELVGPGRAGFQFLDVDKFGIELQREAIEHPPAGQNMADAALGHAGVDHFRGDRVVQIDGHAAIERQGRIRQNRAHRRRQQNAHVGLVASQHFPPQQPSQGQCAGEQGPAGGFHPAGVEDLLATKIAPAHAQEFSRQHKIVEHLGTH